MLDLLLRDDVIILFARHADHGETKQHGGRPEVSEAPDA